ncbi:collagen alpha-1(VII) chain-like [Sarcophilus harrisii]|uniref:collagen alpha-1(VII) chain-like n=1 Tax=Sarcophilus harrisii TaxID=9305 RepID=UPI001301D692|nr:collagen alpha-1(VII) chain-like [Sarcophilus harrisii]
MASGWAVGGQVAPGAVIALRGTGYRRRGFGGRGGGAWDLGALSSLPPPGELEETDRCCREHDQCQQVIHPFTIGYGHHNLRWHPIPTRDRDARCKPGPQAAVLRTPPVWGPPGRPAPRPAPGAHAPARGPAGRVRAPTGQSGGQGKKKEKRTKKKDLLLTPAPGWEPQLGREPEEGKSSVPPAEEGAAPAWGRQDRGSNNILQDEPQVQETAGTPRETEVKAMGQPKKGRRKGRQGRKGPRKNAAPSRGQASAEG